MKKCETCKYLKIDYDDVDSDIIFVYYECILSEKKLELNLNSLRYPRIIFQTYGLGPRDFGCIHHEEKQ